MNKNHARVLGILLVGMMCACQADVEPSAVTTEAPATITASPTIIPTPQVIATPQPSVSLSGSIRLWLNWNPAELESLDHIIRDFLEQHPDVSLAISYYSEDGLFSALEEIEDGGSGPTIVFAPSMWGPKLLQEGRVIDLSDLVDEELELSIHSLAWSQVLFQGAIIALPLEMHGVVLYRNRSLADDAPATVAEWIAAAERLEREQNVGVGLDFGFLYSVSQLTACGGKLFDERGVIAINNPEGICWLNLLTSLREVGLVTFNSDEDLEGFEAGQTVWLIDGTWNAGRVANAIGKDNLMVDPWPVYSATGFRLTGFVWTENAYLLTNSSLEDFEASWVFLRYLLTPEVQLSLSDPRGANHLPSLAGIELDDHRQTQLVYALSLGIPRPLRLDLDLFINPIEGAVRAVTMQGADPELALEMAVSKIDELLPDDETGD